MFKFITSRTKAAKRQRELNSIRLKIEHFKCLIAKTETNLYDLKVKKQSLYEEYKNRKTYYEGTNEISCKLIGKIVYGIWRLEAYIENYTDAIIDLEKLLMGQNKKNEKNTR